MNVVKSLKYLYLKIYPTRFIEFQIGCENLKNISTVVVLNIIGHRTSDYKILIKYLPYMLFNVISNLVYW